MLVSLVEDEVVAASGGVVAEADAGAGVVAAGPGVDPDAGADLDVGGEGDAGDGGLLGVGGAEPGLAEDAAGLLPVAADGRPGRAEAEAAAKSSANSGGGRPASPWKSSKLAVEAASAPPLSPGAPARAAQPSWRNIQPAGSAWPSAQTLPQQDAPLLAQREVVPGADLPGEVVAVAPGDVVVEELRRCWCRWWKTRL